MTLWSWVLDAFQAGLFGLTQIYGGHLGAAIVSLSLVVRAMLLPLTVPMALRTRRRIRLTKAIAPELKAARERHADDPTRMAEETLAVYRRHGASPLDFGGLGGALIQAPILIALFGAVREAVSWSGVRRAFFWVTDLARPDAVLAALAAAAFGLSAALGATETQPAWTWAVSAAVTGIVALTTSAGFALYLVAGGAVGGLQGLLVRRAEARKAG